MKQDTVTLINTSHLNNMLAVDLPDHQHPTISANELNLNTNANISLLDSSGANAVIGWRDLTSDMFIRSGTSSPAVTQFRNGIYLYAFPFNQLREVFANFHIDHDYALGTSLYPHVHWAPNTTSTGTVRWGIEYTVAKGHQQQAFPATTTVFIEHTISTNMQYFHMVSEVSDAQAIPGTGIEPDTMIMMRIYRDAAHANDSFPDDVFGITVDMHYKASKFATRNKAPNFYV